MFWPFVLPFQLTFVLLPALVIAVTLVAPWLKWKRPKTFLISAALAVPAFIPSCIAITLVIDTQRFGEFQHATFREVNDPRVSRWLPPDARDLVIRKYATGYRAKFSIKQTDLDAWHDKFWKRYGERASMGREANEMLQIEEPSDAPPFFAQEAWQVPDELEIYRGPRASNGAGFTLWYDESTETAYQDAGYW